MSVHSVPLTEICLPLSLGLFIRAAPSTYVPALFRQGFQPPLGVLRKTKIPLPESRGCAEGELDRLTVLSEAGVPDNCSQKRSQAKEESH